MFGYPYSSYSRPQSYFQPSTTGYPYNYGGYSQRPRSFYDPYEDDEYSRQLALAERRRRLELEMLREEEERRRREALQRLYGHHPMYQQDEDVQRSIPVQRVKTAPSPPPPVARVPIPIQEPEDSLKPVQSTEPTQDTEPEAQPAEVDTEERNQAASKIQSAYRRRRTLALIDSHHSRFQKLCEEFKMPEKLDYEYEGKLSLSVVPEEHAEGSKPRATVNAKLGYTPNNAPLHYFIEQLNQLLIALDGIESQGDVTIRSKRKEVVKAIEGEVQRVEKLWRSAWERYESL